MNNSYQQGLAELTSLKQQMDGYRPLNKLQVRTLGYVRIIGVNSK